MASGTYSALCYLFGTGYKNAPIYGQDGDKVTGQVSYILLGRA
jgi:hypothetical protein